MESADSSTGARTDSGSTGRTRGGIRKASGGFEVELRGYLQDRLRVVAGFFALVATILLIPSHGLTAWVEEWSVRFLWHPTNLLHVTSVVVAFLVWRRLRAGPMSLRALLGVDVLLVAMTFGVTLGIYAISYDDGMVTMPGLIALFVVVRAIVVPSTVRRTLLLSIPAPIGVLAIQLSYGVLYACDGYVVPQQYFPFQVAWYQVLLWMAVGMAALASRINFSLRVQAWKAKEMDQYVIEGPLGFGGMGEVHRAHHSLMKRPTAIKLIRAELAGKRNLERFEKEVRQTSRLTHPNTIRIYDYGRTPDGEFFYAMELLDGADLEKIVDETGPLPPARVIRILSQTCAALEEAHAKGLVHRDVKPSNLLLSTQGLDRDVVKIMDFGLVKDTKSTGTTLTQADEICGSPHTISPEALTNGEVTGRSDLYSLGAVGCFLLTAQPVFDAQTVVEFAAAHLHRDPRPPSTLLDGVPADLETILLACLQKDPEQRPADARAMRESLEACADADAWTQEDAHAWWQAHGEKFTSGG